MPSRTKQGRKQSVCVSVFSLVFLHVQGQAAADKVAEVKTWLALPHLAATR